VRDLAPRYGADCPVVVAYRVSWPDERLIRGTLADIRDRVKEAGITRTALILVGRALAGELVSESRLAPAPGALTRVSAGAARRLGGEAGRARACGCPRPSRRRRGR
jgi:siroheme synthase